MLDAATGLGRGIATAGGRFDPVYAVDISDAGVRRATEYWGRGRGIHWIVADVTAMDWPPEFFGLVCAFGFTDLPFFSRLRTMIAPGGMLLYEGFSARQLEVKPALDPAWTATPRGRPPRAPCGTYFTAGKCLLARRAARPRSGCVLPRSGPLYRRGG